MARWVRTAIAGLLVVGGCGRSSPYSATTQESRTPFTTTTGGPPPAPTTTAGSARQRWPLEHRGMPAIEPRGRADKDREASMSSLDEIDFFDVILPDIGHDERVAGRIKAEPERVPETERVDLHDPIGRLGRGDERIGKRDAIFAIGTHRIRAGRGERGSEWIDPEKLAEHGGEVLSIPGRRVVAGAVTPASRVSALIGSVPVMLSSPGRKAH